MFLYNISEAFRGIQEQIHKLAPELTPTEKTPAVVLEETPARTPGETLEEILERISKGFSGKNKMPKGIL